MRCNETGRYIVTEDENLIKDPDNDEEMLFMVDEKNKVVIRSMLENDIDTCIKKMDMKSSYEREKLKEELYKKIPQKGSEFRFFVVEKIIGEKKNNSWNEIYELERVPIGMGEKVLHINHIIRKMKEGIEIIVFSKEEKHIPYIQENLKRLAEYFGITGETWSENIN